MKKNYLVILLVFCLLFSNVSLALTNGILVDDYFEDAYAYLGSNRKLEISATTKFLVYSIQVTSCELWVKNGSTWSFSKYLDTPNTITYNNDFYNSSINYTSSDFGAGTYKILVRITADGHTISVFSNIRTF